ncbi:MAG: TlpA family protein disulfide reductase [Spirochaetota bacterium]
MSKKIIFISLLLFSALFLIGCGGNADTEEPASDLQESAQQPSATSGSDGDSGSLVVQKGYELSTLSGQTLGGREISPSVLKRADLTVMNVWTTTCPYCIEEMPDLEEVSHLVEDKGVQVIGIIGDGSHNPEDAQDLIDRTGVTYLNVVPSSSFEKKLFSIAYAVPTTVFLDRNGRMIGEPVVGKRDTDFFMQRIDTALSQL